MEITERISTWKSRKELQPENLGKDYDLEISERIILSGNLGKDYTTWKSWKGLYYLEIYERITAWKSRKRSLPGIRKTRN